MRRVLFTMLLFVLTASVSKAQRPPIFCTEEKCFGVNAGYKHLSLNAGSFDVGYVELSCFINPTLGWEFTTNLEYGKDYLSFSPSGLLGLPFWIYATSHNSGREANMLGAILSVASARMPLKICDWLEFDPGWNLLKLTKLYSHPLKSQFLRDIVLTHYLAYFLEHAPKSFHCSFEVIGRCRQKNVHSISHHTFIKVAAQSVI